MWFFIFHLSTIVSWANERIRRRRRTSIAQLLLIQLIVQNFVAHALSRYTLSMFVLFSPSPLPPPKPLPLPVSLDEKVTRGRLLIEKDHIDPDRSANFKVRAQRRGTFKFATSRAIRFQTRSMRSSGLDRSLSKTKRSTGPPRCDLRSVRTKRKGKRPGRNKLKHRTERTNTT